MVALQVVNNPSLLSSLFSNTPANNNNKTKCTLNLIQIKASSNNKKQETKQQQHTLNRRQFTADTSSVFVISLAATAISPPLSKAEEVLSDWERVYLPLDPTHEVDHGNETALQKHVKFFDRNGDGIIYPSETYEGFRAIGCGVLLSSFAAVFINVGLSGKTRPGESTSLKFPIVIKNINLGKHGSDTDAYDEAGRFVPRKFDEIFEKHARSNGHSLTSDELMGMLKANREPKDFGGWVGSYVEWKILYNLGKDKNGLLPKDTVRAVYDGSLFEQMAKAKALSEK